MAAAYFLAACSSSGSEDNSPVNPETPATKLPIKLNTRLSRVSDASFDSGDHIGLYVVNYANGTTGTLKNTGNHVNNMRFTYTASSVWEADTPVYWADNETHADFYAYHPYTGSISHVNQLSFSVKTSQAAEADYKGSDFVYGKTANVAPTENAVNIMASHLMSNMLITVKPGNGFTSEALAAADIQVAVNGVKTAATIDLATGAVTASGGAKTCTPWLSDGTYKLLVVPQTVASTQLITVTIDGKPYNLTKEFTFEQGKVYSFPVVVTRTNSGINVGVNPWEADGEDHGGLAE